MIEEALRELHRQKVANPKPIALDTPLRFSSAGACSRQLGYQAMRAEQTDPMDLGGLVVTELGTLRHEQIQNLLLKSVSGWIPRVEVASQVGVWSGSCDILEQPDEKTIYELKTVGTYKRDQLFGIRGYKRIPAQDPPLNNVLQLGLQMRGLGAEWGYLVYLPNEPYSKGVAEALGLSDIERVMKMFAYHYDDIAEDVDREVERGRDIAEQVADGILPDRWAFDEKAEKWKTPDINGQFPCGYCSWRTRCKEDG